MLNSASVRVFSSSDSFVLYAFCGDDYLTNYMLNVNEAYFNRDRK